MASQPVLVIFLGLTEPETSSGLEDPLRGGRHSEHSPLEQSYAWLPPRKPLYTPYDKEGDGPTPARKVGGTRVKGTRGNLQRMRLTARYRAILAKCFMDFTTYADIHHGVSVSQLRKPVKANKIMVRYLQWMFGQGRKPSEGTNSVLALQHHIPHLKSRLRKSWESVQAWKQAMPGKLRRPIPPLLIRGLFLFSLRRGLGLSSSTQRPNLFRVLRVSDI